MEIFLNETIKLYIELVKLTYIHHSQEWASKGLWVIHG